MSKKKGSNSEKEFAKKIAESVIEIISDIFERFGNGTENDNETRRIRIIGTSDLHGKFFPWDYALNEESTSGSMTQLASAIAQY